MEQAEGLCLIAEDLSFVAANRGEKGSTKLILDRVNLLAQPGEMLAIMGPSGSGKTSLLNIIAGRTRNFLYDLKEPLPPLDFASGGPSPIPSEVLSQQMRMKKAPLPYGKIYLNGQPATYARLKATSRYVMQSDCLLPFLSVHETIRFAAQLKLTHLHSKERAKVVDDIITNLGLDICRDTAIGDQTLKGISGGQRKRVSIAIELLENPQVIFLDEPTSGLDSSLAFDVIEVVKNLVKKSREEPNERGLIRPKTVICTIHQPRKQIFEMFHRLALLSKGRLVYQGPAKEIVEFWAQVQHPVPLRQNIADWSLDLLIAGHESDENEESVRKGSSFRAIIGRAASLVPVDPMGNSASFVARGEVDMAVTNRSFINNDAGDKTRNLAEGQMVRRVLVSDEEIDTFPAKFVATKWGAQLQEGLAAAKRRETPPDLLNAERPARASGLGRWVMNTLTLSHRYILNKWRNKPALVIQCMVTFLLSIFIAFVFWRIDMPKSQSDCVAYFNVVGIASFTGINQSFTMMQNWVGFPLQRPMINREKAGGLYNSAACLVGMALGDVPYIFIPSIIHVLTVYWIVGIGTTAGHFFAYYFYALLSCWAATGWLMIASMIAPSSASASAIAPVGNILAMLLCGLWITESALPAFWRVCQYVSWIRYGINGFLLFRFKDTGIPEACAGTATTPGPMGNFVTLFCLGIIFRFIAYLALAFTNTRQGLE